MTRTNNNHYLTRDISADIAQYLCMFLEKIIDLHLHTEFKTSYPQNLWIRHLKEFLVNTTIQLTSTKKAVFLPLFVNVLLHLINH